jgi:hypoxanthine phosphoribosyltransferase
MPGSASKRELLEVEWSFFGEICRALALKVARGYDPQVVVGIAKAGAVPAAIIATILRRELVIARPSEGAKPQLTAGPSEYLRGRRVLLVDETCDSGDTMRLAVHEVSRMEPTDIMTAVSFRTGQWTPDFHAFETDRRIVLPWDREVVEGGELIPRTDLRLTEE